MEKEKIEFENPVAVAGMTLIPVTRVSLNYWNNRGGLSFFGVKQPIGMVVVSPSAKRAFRITGEEISLDQIIAEIPGIKKVLEGI